MIISLPTGSQTVKILENRATENRMNMNCQDAEGSQEDLPSPMNPYVFNLKQK